MQLPFLAMQYLASIQNTDSCSTEKILEKWFTVFTSLLSPELFGGQNGIGTTFSAVRLGDRFIFAQVGDSVIFHFDGSSGTLRQVSRSHTLEAELLAKMDRRSQRYARAHAHTLTRCMCRSILQLILGIFCGCRRFFVDLHRWINKQIEFEIETLCRQLNVNQLVHQLIDLATKTAELIIPPQSVSR